MENGAVKKSGQELIQHFLNKTCIIFLEVSHCRRVAQNSGNKDVYKKLCCMCKAVFLLVIKPIDFLCRSHYCRHLSLNYFIFCLSIL